MISTESIKAADYGTTAKREKIKLERIAAVDSKVEANAKKATGAIWFDTAELTSPDAQHSLFARLASSAYTGVLLHVTTFESFLAVAPKRLQKIIQVASLADVEAVLNAPGAKALTGSDSLIFASENQKVLESLQTKGIKTCLRVYVDDRESLLRSIDNGCRHSFLMIRFRDPTNIPLELVIASLQATQTVLVKEISSAEDIEDALVSLGVMEVGADGVMFSPSRHDLLDEFTRRLSDQRQPHVALEVATIVRTQPVGMGYRSCLDLTTLFSETEGLLVGSTSQGGFLCCPEVFFLPYMELRPFRVNAGAVHSYVYNTGNRTDYMTELHAGSPVMIVDRDGKVRHGAVGRTKTELRPLRLIEAEFKNGERINVIMQDDWHVRIFSEDAKPLNITELKAGDRVLAHKAEPGRHVGIKIDENILEN